MNDTTQTIKKRAGVLDPKFVYIPSFSTDILKRFRALGWVPPSELKDKK
jgi:hypothetical protein